MHHADGIIAAEVHPGLPFDDKPGHNARSVCRQPISGVDPFESAKQVQATQEQAMAGQQQAAAAGAIGSRAALESPVHRRRPQVAGAAALSPEQKDAFDKAFSVRLEGKDYLVKYCGRGDRLGPSRQLRLSGGACCDSGLVPARSSG